MALSLLAISPEWKYVQYPCTCWWIGTILSIDFGGYSSVDIGLFRLSFVVQVYYSSVELFTLIQPLLELADLLEQLNYIGLILILGLLTHSTC